MGPTLPPPPHRSPPQPLAAPQPPGRLHRDMPCTCQLWPHAAWAPHVLATAACQPPPAWPHHKPVICEPGVWRERGWPPAASSGDTNWVKAALLTLPQTSLPLPFQLIATSQTWHVILLTILTLGAGGRFDSHFWTQSGAPSPYLAFRAPPRFQAIYGVESVYRFKLF